MTNTSFTRWLFNSRIDEKRNEIFLERAAGGAVEYFDAVLRLIN